VHPTINNQFFIEILGFTLDMGEKPLSTTSEPRSGFQNFRPWVKDLIEIWVIIAIGNPIKT
jgi:hypothetical protein